jgi:hypothetical protein
MSNQPGVMPAAAQLAKLLHASIYKQQHALLNTRYVHGGC